MVSGRSQDQIQVHCIVLTVQFMARFCVVISRVELVYCINRVAMHRLLSFVLISQTRFWYGIVEIDGSIYTYQLLYSIHDIILRTVVEQLSRIQ